MDRFDYEAARSAARELIHALSRYRRRLTLRRFTEPSGDQCEIQASIERLAVREQALRDFLNDPYRADSPLRMDPRDRTLLTSPGELTAARGRSTYPA